MFGRPAYDIYTVNCSTGEKNKALTSINRVSAVGPNDKYFVYVKDDNLHLFDIRKGTSINITENLDGQFFMGHEYDYPVDQKPPYRGGFVSCS